MAAMETRFPFGKRSFCHVPSSWLRMQEDEASDLKGREHYMFCAHWDSKDLWKIQERKML